MNELHFVKCLDTKDPIWDLSENAGIDVFVPFATTEFVNQLREKNPDCIISNDIIIPPHKDILIDTGLKTVFDKDKVLIAFNKSGIASKLKLVAGACIIDSSYRGHIHIHLINTSDEDARISFGQKIIQYVLLNLPQVDIKVFDEEGYEFPESKRGEGGFGSTGV